MIYQYNLVQWASLNSLNSCLSMPALYNTETSTQRHSQTWWPVLAVHLKRTPSYVWMSQIGRVDSKMKLKLRMDLNQCWTKARSLPWVPSARPRGSVLPKWWRREPSSERFSKVWRDTLLQHPVKVVSRHVACLSLVSVWQCGQWTAACTTPQSSVEISTVGPVQPALVAGGL